MKHNITFVPKAFDSYKEWAINDKQIFKKINELIQSIDRTPFEGIGKPEPLKHCNVNIIIDILSHLTTYSSSLFDLHPLHRVR